MSDPANFQRAVVAFALAVVIFAIVVTLRLMP